MALKQISCVVIMRNGKRLEGLKNFKEGEQEYMKEVDLMDGAGTVPTAQKYKFSLEYVIPRENAKVDWSDVIDETWTIEIAGSGKRISYSGVDCLKRGESTYDGQDAAVIPLEFIATSRDVD